MSDTDRCGHGVFFGNACAECLSLTYQNMRREPESESRRAFVDLVEAYRRFLTALNQGRFDYTALTRMDERIRVLGRALGVKKVE